MIHTCTLTSASGQFLKQKARTETKVAETDVSEAKQTWLCRTGYQIGGNWVGTRGRGGDSRCLYGMVPQALGLGLACTCQDRDLLWLTTEWLLVGWDIKRDTTGWAMVGAFTFCFSYRTHDFHTYIIAFYVLALLLGSYSLWKEKSYLSASLYMPKH